MRSEKRGFTLLEVLVVMFITGMILPLIGTAFYVLITVPTKETSKLTTINDVQLAFNWIRDDAMRAQYYSGSPTMLEKVIAIDFDECSPGVDCGAWESSGAASSEPEPSSPGTAAVNPGDYNAISQSDSVWWVTDGTGNNDGHYNYHVYQLTIDPVEYPKTDINRLSVTWLGHGEAESGYDTTLKVWNHDTGSWRTLDSRDGMGGDGTLSSALNPETDVADTGEVYLLAQAEHYYDDYVPPTCPHVFGWNGTGYRFIDEAIPDSFLKRYEETSYQTTTTLEPRDGYYDIIVHDNSPETNYINAVDMWAVDHPEGTEIVLEQPMLLAPGRSGTVHTVRHPQPVTAVDREGNDVTDLLAQADGEYWVSDLEGRDFNDIGNLFDWVTITLPDAPETGTAKLIVGARESRLGAFQAWYCSHFILGTPNQPWLYDKLENDEGFYRYFDLVAWQNTAFTVQYRDGSAWVDYVDIPFVNKFFGSTRVVLINLSEIEGNHVRLHTLAGLREIDYVAVDYSADEAVTVTELTIAEAALYSGDSPAVDVLGEIDGEDGSYAVMEQGEYIGFKFTAQASPPEDGFQRTFVIPVRGYYYIRGPAVPEDKMYNWPLAEEVTYVPYAYAKWTLPRYVNPEEYPFSENDYVEKSELGIPVFPLNETNSLHANYVRLTLVVPKEEEEQEEETLVYGSFSWVDRTGTESHSHTTQYRFEDNRLLRDEWVDNNLLSTVVAAHHIAVWEDVEFDFHPRGDLTRGTGKEGQPYLIVRIKTNTSEGQYSQWARSTEIYTLRGIGLSRGFAVLARGRTGNPVDIRGEGLSVHGNIYSYRGVYIGGERHSITGVVEAVGQIDDAAGVLSPDQLVRFSTRADAAWSLSLDDFIHLPEYKDREFIYDGSGGDHWDLESCDECFTNSEGHAPYRIWEDDDITLKTAVYYNPYGNISLTVTNATGMVTLIGERVIVTADYSRLSALSNGVVVYATGSDDGAVWYNSDDPLGLGTRWSGSLFAPSGGVHIGGKNFAVYGSVAAMRFFYDGENTDDENSLILY